MSSVRPPKWVNDLVAKTYDEVPGYRSFLKSRGFKTLPKFSKLPIVSKESYIKKYPRQNLVRGSQLPNAMYASSGSSGRPTFWYMDNSRQQEGVEVHDILLRETFKIKKKEKTLVINCFSMGLWVAGVYTADSFKGLSSKGYNITVVSPGIRGDDIVSILKDIAPEYKNIIITGYPAFVMDVIASAKQKRVQFRPKGTFFLLAGDKVSEQWRLDLVQRLGLVSSSKKFPVATAYGCADLAVIGIETPLSIKIRQTVLADKDLYAAMFGHRSSGEPGLYQYDPRFLFVESIGGELTFTANTAIPLIRYNLNDVGKVYHPGEMKNILSLFGYHSLSGQISKNLKQMPFVMIKGRNDVATTFYALNILPEHVQAILQDPSIDRQVSGNYALYNKFVYKSKKERLWFDVELAPGKKISKQLLSRVRESFIKNLENVNVEYRKLYATIGKQAEPNIRLYINNDPGFLRGKKGLVYVNGKKPRIIL